MLHFELVSREHPDKDRAEFVGNSDWHSFIKDGNYLCLLKYLGECKLYWYFENYSLTGSRTVLEFRKTLWKKTVLVFALEDSLN